MRVCFPKAVLLLVLWAACPVGTCFAQEKADKEKPDKEKAKEDKPADKSSDKKTASDKPIVGLIPKAPEGLKLDGKLDEWGAAFVTPLHVGHPDFANRGCHVLFLWDDDNLYIGLRCLDRKPNHTGPDNQLSSGDALELYLDTRRGSTFGTAEYRPGTLRMVWTPFTGAEVKPRLQVRDNVPAFKGLKLDGAEVAGQITPWGYTAEFKLPWGNFPAFTADVGEIIGIDCELCSSDGGTRVDRAFVYSSSAAGASPSGLGRVRLVDKIDPKDLEPLGRALLPLSLMKSANYDWLYGAVGVSPTIEKNVAKLEGRIVDETGKVRKTAPPAAKRPIDGVDAPDFALWWQRWDLSELPPGAYTLELTALDEKGTVITQRKQKLLHDNSNNSPAGGPNGGPLASKESPSKESDKSAPPKKKEDEPPPSKEKDDDPPPPKKSSKSPPAKEGDKSPPAKKGTAKEGDDKPDPGDLPKPEKR